MSRVAIIGSGGSKTMLAYLLAQSYGLPPYEVDQIQRKPGWEREEVAVVAAWHSEILRSEK